MVKISKEKKIKELQVQYKGALSEYIINWYRSLNGEDIKELFWKGRKPEDVGNILKESDLI